jgi:formylglycine-generating enzyme required for sulfatase activity
VWPWGDVPKSNACNLGQQAGCGGFGFSCGPVPVRSFEGCRNGNGIFDLIGNVTEWLGNCAALKVDAPEGACSTIGGSYDDTIENLTCRNALSTFSKSGRSPRIGFRCCYDLTPVERQTCGLP